MLATAFKTMTALVVSCLAAILTPAITSAQINPHVEASEASKLYPGKAYSPYAQREFPSQVYWGETHLHTGYSLDSGLFGNTLTHQERAYTSPIWYTP